MKQTLFLGIFGPNLPPKKFSFENWAMSYLGIAILHHCAKNQKKILSQSQEMLIFPENGKREFPQIRKCDFYGQKKFSGKNGFSHFLENLALYLSAKNQKKLMKQFRTKSKKPYV